MDLTDSIAPKSDQLDYEDLLAGEREFTIKEVRKGPSPEQPIEIVLAEFDRPWRPAKTVRRILVAAWGPDGTQYVGRRVLLYGDPTVRFAGQEVGGIRVKALSGITKPFTVALTVTRGKRAPVTVQPLPDAPHAPQKPAQSISDRMHTLGLDAASMRALTARVVGHEAGWADLTDTERADVTGALDVWESTGADPTLIDDVEATR